MLSVIIVLLLQVRESDEGDPFRERTVMLLDDFKISGINGTRILLTLLWFMFQFSVCCYTLKICMKNGIAGKP